MSNLALLFSGQGAQYSGMGIKLRDYPAGRETLQEASDALGMDMAHICCNASDEELSSTEITQPVIVTCSIAAFRILARDLESFDSTATAAVAGLSVGEYSALVASESLGFANALRLVRERGRLMAEAAIASPGTMVAVLGLENDVVTEICAKASTFGVVSPANFNSPGQVVISGEKEAVQRAAELADKAGAKRCIPLSVSGAFHSVLMKSAESGLREILSDIQFSKPKLPFIANVTGKYLEAPGEIVEMLARQLASPIQWWASISRMMDAGIDSFVEVGPGKILAGLIRRVNKKLKISSSDNML